MLALQRLQKKMQEVCRLHPWYGGMIAQETVAGLDALPLLTSRVLEEHYYCAPTQPGLAVYRTSGTSSGKRKSIVYSRADDNRYMAIKARIFGSILEGSECTRALADMGTGHAARTALAIFRKLGLEACSISFELPVEEHIRMLETFRPDLLYTMPSILERIADAAADPKAFGIRRIILVGEVAPPAWQRHMAQTFGLEERHITDTYGSIEIGTIAYYSHEHQRYLLADGLYGEGVDTAALGEGLEPLENGEQVLVLTSFVRKQLPALRFVTYDVVRDLRPVLVDGVMRQSFSAIVKRVGRELKHGEKISLYDIEQAVRRHAEEARVRLRVEVRNKVLHVKLSGISLTDAAAAAIHAEIRESIPEIGLMIRNRLLGDIRVETAEPGENPSVSTVKGKRIHYGAKDGLFGAEEVFESGILAAVGNTPSLKLTALSREWGLELYGKMELLNPGGSAKDRPALRMIREAWRAGAIRPGGTIVESSSGNMAISLAMIGGCLGLQVICVVDPRTTNANLAILRALGAKIDLVEQPDPATGEFLPARLARVQQLVAEIPGSFWPNQYANRNNVLAHYHTTMPEIVHQLQTVDYVFCAVSTCGTLRGLSEYARDHGLPTQFVAVDAEGSAIFGGNGGKRHFPGLGAGIVPPFCEPGLAHRVIHVTDREILAGCRELAEKEALLAGASSGAVIAAIRRVREELPRGTVCAAILHDKGERYMDTVFSEDWARRTGLVP